MSEDTEFGYVAAKPAREDSWRGQPVAYSARPLTAALCYDRIAVPSQLLDPHESSWQEHFQYGKWLGREASGEFEPRVMVTGFRLGKEQELLEFAAIANSSTLSGEQLAEIEAWTGALVIPVLDDRTNYAQVLPKGSREVLVTSLVDLDVVDEQELNLTQVIEFRRDQEATRKYRRLLSWLDKKAKEMSEKELLETMEQKLDDYTWALKKHGIKTKIGIVSEILDGKYLLGASAATVAVGHAGFPMLGLIAGATVIAGRVGVRLATDRLELKDIARGGERRNRLVIRDKKTLRVRRMSCAKKGPHEVLDTR